jgi:hypothetical protein
MKDLIEALSIFLKYEDPHTPTCCEHDVLFVQGSAPCDMQPKDAAQLEALSFSYQADLPAWRSFRFGSY